MADVLTIVNQRPVDRLRTVRNRSQAAAIEVDALLALYETFLQSTDRSKKDLIQDFLDTTIKKARATDGRAFGERMFALLQELGREGRGRELFRHMVV